MSDEKHEKIADIVREMRQAEATWHRSEIAQLPTQYLKEWSDRIEAAAKRECEATREKSSQVGNAAKMREALSRILGIADHLQTRFAIPKLASEEILELKQIAESALAAPPRNCDLYRTKKELDAAYDKYREYVIMSNSNPFVAKDEMMTKEDWLFAEAKGEAK